MDTLEKLRQSQNQAAELVSWHMGSSSSYHEKKLPFAKQLLARRKSELYRFVDIAEVVAELCVKKRLPGGDPCWMAERLMSYI